MENPVKEIERVVALLYKGDRHVQSRTINAFYSPSATYSGPFCISTLGFFRSKWTIIQLFQWSKLVFPKVDLDCGSISYDHDSAMIYMILNVKYQNPLFSLEVSPVLVFGLRKIEEANGNNDDEADDEYTTAPEKQNQEDNEVPPRVEPPTKFYIQSQREIYSPTDYMRSLLPWYLAVIPLKAVRLLITTLCIILTIVISSIIHGSDHNNGRFPEDQPNQEPVRHPDDTGPQR